MLQHVFRFVGHGADQAFFVAGEDERQVSVLNPVLFIAKPVPDIMFSVFFDFGQYFLQSYFFQEMTLSATTICVSAKRSFAASKSPSDGTFNKVFSRRKVK